MSEELLPEYLHESAFEAPFLGGPVWRLTDPARAAEAVALAGVRGCRLISCRVPQGSGDALAAAGFRHVETLVSMARPVRGVTPPIPAGVRVARRRDGAACAAIARTAFVHDRFHADPEIPDTVAEAIKEQWIANDLAGRADCVLVAEEGWEIIGFNALMIDEAARCATIDLIAVSRGRQGAGAGRRLVEAALAVCSRRADRLSLGTQAGNMGSLAFYHALGFAETGRADTWHWTP